jgi:hypothetical protein
MNDWHEQKQLFKYYKAHYQWNDIVLFENGHGTIINI